MIVWIDNFMQNEHTTLKIKKQSTFMKWVKIDISQFFLFRSYYIFFIKQTFWKSSKYSNTESQL
jgi:hypothetical protein